MPPNSSRVLPEDERFMRLAIEQARKGDQTPGAGEVGCVIVRDGEVLAEGHNEAKLRHDPTAHAEIVTLRKLGEKLQTVDFRGCTLYCTLQPCGMCSVACVWAKITRIVYGATRSDVHSMYFDTRHFNTADLIRDAFREDLEIVGGVLAEECTQFYYRPGDNPPREEQVNV
jgi:tRNA(adenine34) deaminase